MALTAAELYRALHRGSPGDLAFYRQACAGAYHILELGCGYGRLIEALAEPGRSLTGLDRDEGLLNLARQTQLEGAHYRWLHQDMCPLDLEQRFDRILLAFNTFYCLPQDKKLPLLQGIHHHLKPGGTFVMDAYAVEKSETVGYEQFSPPAPIVTLDLPEGALDVYEESFEDYEQKTIQVTYTFRREGRVVTQQSIEHAYWYSDEFHPALASCGFKEIHQFEGFGTTPTQVVLTARR